LDFARATADRWIVLLDGQVVADGPAEDVLHDENLILTGAIGKPSDMKDIK
jgi:ABC-type hemin transport system ATPase subunit